MQSVLRGLAIDHCGQRIVIEHFDIAHIGGEHRFHQPADLGPVDHMGVEIDPQTAHQVGDVVGGNLGVPAAVHVDGERAQPELLGADQRVAAVHPARDADDAVIGLALAVGFDPGDQLIELALARGGIGIDIVIEPLKEFGAVIAHAIIVEDDVCGGVVHDAARADAVVAGIGQVSVPKWPGFRRVADR